MALHSSQIKLKVSPTIMNSPGHLFWQAIAKQMRLIGELHQEKSNWEPVMVILREH